MSYNFQRATQAIFFKFEKPKFEGQILEELMLAKPSYFNETNNTIEKFLEVNPKVKIGFFRWGLADGEKNKKVENEGIERQFIKCNKPNKNKILFICVKWLATNFWNQPEPLVEPPAVFDVPIVEVVAETETATILEEVVLPANVSIPEPEPIPPLPLGNPNQKPSTKTFNGREYYSANELKENYPEYFRGIKKGHIRGIIELKGIPKETECVYAMLVKKDLTWKLYPATTKPAGLFISKDWCDENMFDKSTSSDEEVKVKSKYEIAPHVIEVSDERMFKDLNGEPIPIEIRGNLINGQLDEDNLYFNLDDTSKGFGIPNLYMAVIKDETSYVENEDYKKFYVKNSHGANIYNVYICPEEKIGVQVFLTYNGLLRVLMVSRNANAKKFRKWATHILFTHQFGNKDQKQQLASTLLGQPCDVVKRCMSN
jgi:hypothetical protein